MRSRTVVAATITVAVALLAGCAAQSPADDTEPTTTLTEAVEPTPTTPPPAHGATLTTPDEHAAAEAADMAVYEVSDGTVLALDPAQALPPVVYADLFAELADQMTDPWGLERSGDTSWLESRVRNLARDTGKSIVLVHPSWGWIGFEGHDDADEPPVVAWGVSGNTDQMPPENLLVTEDQAAKLAQIQAWVDAQPASEHWELLIAAAPTVPRPAWGMPLPDGTVPNPDGTLP